MSTIRRRPLLVMLVAAGICLLCISLFFPLPGEAVSPDCDVIALLLGAGPALGHEDISFDGERLQVRTPKCLKELENRLPKGAEGSGPSVSEAFQIGFEAYVYGYPIVMYGQTQLVSTNVATANTHRAPLNQFMYGTIAGPDETDVVLPNVNVLYNNAFLSLGPEPIVLHIPDTQGRFFIQQIMDAWTNVDHDPGMRIQSPPGDYLLTGPGWAGTVPSTITQVLRMPTNLAWIAGRVFISGPSDTQAAVIQKQFTLRPLSQYGNPSFTPPSNQFVNPAIDTQTPPIDQVTNMSAGTFFGMLATMWMTNPPQAVDGPALAQLAKVGLVPNSPYDLSQQPLATQLGMTLGAQAAFAYITSDLALFHVHGKGVNGWTLTVGFNGQWATNYVARAVTAFRGIGANAAQDAVYGYAQRDHTGKVLNGASRYTLTFPAGSLPPVEPPYGENGFWSVTVYNTDGFLGDTPNVMGSTQLTPPVTWTPNKDGSYTIVIQQDQPADTSNWIKPPAGDFVLLLRLYSPLTQVYVKTDPQFPYTPPFVKRVSGPPTPDGKELKLLDVPFVPLANGLFPVPQ